MRLTWGKYKGRTIEVVVLKDPEFIGVLLKSRTQDETKCRIQTEARLLVETFNRRKFQTRCASSGCSREVSRCSIYKTDVFNPRWWCETCDPWQFGARSLVLSIVATYEDAIRYARPYGDPTLTRDLVHVLAEAKGLSGFKLAQLGVFFHG
jgi:hypothetical protein